MITTITTVTTVTTATAITALGLSAVVSVVAVVALIAFLTTRELASTGHSRFCLRITRFVSVGILPLVMAFAIMVAVEIVKVL